MWLDATPSYTNRVLVVRSVNRPVRLPNRCIRIDPTFLLQYPEQPFLNCYLRQIRPINKYGRLASDPCDHYAEAKHKVQILLLCHLLCTKSRCSRSKQLSPPVPTGCSHFEAKPNERAQNKLSNLFRMNLDSRKKSDSECPHLTFGGRQQHVEIFFYYLRIEWSTQYIHEHEEGVDFPPC